MIRSDWTARPLRSCLRSTPDYGINAAAVPFDDGLPTYLRITDISEANRFKPSPRVSVKHPHMHAFFLRKGDLVLARTGASVGKSYLYATEDGPLVFAGFLIRMTPDPEILDPVFLSYCVQSKRYWDWVATMSIRSGQPGINGQEYGTFQVSLPKPSEQRAIAEALSDVDQLLGSLEKLIAKKRAIKQAAMQQLLTGKTRLPGFSGEWETITLGGLEQRGDIRLLRGKVISQKDIDRLPGDYPIYSSSVHLNGLFGSYGDYMFDEELITWSVDGGGHFFHRPKHRYSVTNVCGYLRIWVSSIDYRYLAYHLQNLHSRKVFDYTVKAHPSVIRGAYNVALPQLSEQRAIATVLSDMDAEIAVLERRRDKTRTIKQGMMQQLLTGRVRLVSARERNDHAS